MAGTMTWFRLVRGTLESEQVFGDDAPLPVTVKVGQTTFRMKEARPRIRTDMQRPSARPTSGGLERTRALDGGETQTRAEPGDLVPNELMFVTTERQGLNGREGAIRCFDGGAEYYSERGIQFTPLDFDAAEAVRRAEEFLRDHGEFPSDAVCAEVRAIMDATFDLESDRLEVMQPVEYEVRFMQRLGDGAGLLVCPNGQGVREVYKKWFSATPGPADAGGGHRIRGVPWRRG